MRFKTIDEDEKMEGLFFVENHSADRNRHWMMMHYINDLISKDIGVPFHQISIVQVRHWREEDFQSVKFQAYWTESTEGEKARHLG